jgi:hypothetical protein
VAALGGLVAELGGQGREDADLVFGLRGQGGRAAAGLEVEQRPQGGQDVQGVQAQVVGGPAGAEGGGQVPVAGPVDLLDPGVQPGDWFVAGVGGEVPPGGRRAGLVAAGILLGGRGGWVVRAVSSAV